MILIKCRCGASSNMFKKNIGPFYVEQCCEDKGYNHLGELVNKPITQKEVDALNEALTVNPPPVNQIFANVDEIPAPPSMVQTILDKVKKPRKPRGPNKPKKTDEPPKGS